MRRRFFASLLVATSVLSPGLARGSMVYPDLIKQQLGVSCAPACTVCHNNPNGGTGTVTTPFGREMVGLGLTAENPASLQRALDLVKAGNLSAIGDGIPDTQALTSCLDPNLVPAAMTDGGMSPAHPPTLDPTPEYGCGVAQARNAPAGAQLLLFAAFLTWRRCRARRNRP